MAATALSAMRSTTRMSSAPGPAHSTLAQRIWLGISSAGAFVLGVLPHVLHHVALFAGALFAGVGGSLLFGGVGILASIPLLMRVHHRTGTWRVPAALLALFTVIFSISTFVVGPAITSGLSTKGSPTSEQTRQPAIPGPTEKDIHGH